MADRHDRHDGVDDWLSERIEPLAPPPGTFDLIKRRARRRKFRKLAITASSAAVIVAAAVTVPQVVNLPVLNENPTPGPVAGVGHSTAARTARGIAGSSPSAYAQSAQPAPTTAPAPVPPDFRPSSVTFVGPRTGWVIGQAGSAGHCATQYCTSVARTDDAGRTWSGVPAPLAGAPDGATGVSQIRFLNLKNGWAFGPGLFVTHTGGKTWTPVETGGLRVTDLETVGNRVYALWASCAGTGAAYASACSAVTLYSASAGGGAWAPVGPATTGLAGTDSTGGSGGPAALVLTPTRGYLLTPGGTLYAGPVDGSAPWRKAGTLPAACATGSGLPSELLGAVSANDLILACLPPGGSSVAEQKLLYSSADGGASWSGAGTAPSPGFAASIAASPAGSAVLAGNRGIELRPAGASAWQAATLTGTAPNGGFSYVGMTTDEHGIALPADPTSGTIWFTFDGGQTWQPSPVTSS
jgi:hypothetical protein